MSANKRNLRHRGTFGSGNAIDPLDSRNVYQNAAQT
jgi:hypothetical protein